MSSVSPPSSKRASQGVDSRRKRLDAGELAAKLGRIRALLARGCTLTKTGADARVKLSKSEVHRIAVRHGMPRQRTWTAPEKRKKIDRLLKSGEDRQVIARLVEVAYNAVYKRSLKLTSVPRKVRDAVRCGCGALVDHVPCVACQTRAAIAKQSACPPRPLVLPEGDI